jgi:hypothetical protein
MDQKSAGPNMSQESIHPSGDHNLNLLDMTLIASITKVPSNGKIVKIMCAFEFSGRLSQNGH